MQDEKYFVFKKEDIDKWCIQYEIDIPEPIQDAIVIRRQDKFAPPALDAYANSILIVVEGMEDREKADKLREIADYFSQQAAEAWQTDRKLPD